MRKTLATACLLLGVLAAPASGEPVMLESGIRVQVKGLVKRPGVYRLLQGARGADAIQAAGGILPGAELTGLNLAAALQDGEAVWVPRRGTSAGGGATGSNGERRAARRNGSASGQGSSAGPLSLNAATLAQLDALPGVGPAIAGDIIAYRTKQGGFKSLDELREVAGIGERKLSRLRPHLRL